MKLLGGKNIDSILAGGRPELFGTALEDGIVSKVETYIAPKIFGGECKKTPVEGMA